MLLNLLQHFCFCGFTYNSTFHIQRTKGSGDDPYTPCSNKNNLFDFFGYESTFYITLHYIIRSLCYNIFL